MVNRMGMLMGVSIFGLGAGLTYVFGYAGFLIVYDSCIAILCFARPHLWCHPRRRFSFWVFIAIATLIFHGLLIPSAVMRQ